MSSIFKVFFLVTRPDQRAKESVKNSCPFLQYFNRPLSSSTIVTSSPLKTTRTSHNGQKTSYLVQSAEKSWKN